MNIPLLSSAYVLLLLATIGSLVVSWRTLRINVALQTKIDWLRATLISRDASIRSYESGSPDDAHKTSVMPPPLRPRRP